MYCHFLYLLSKFQTRQNDIIAWGNHTRYFYLFFKINTKKYPNNFATDVTVHPITITYILYIILLDYLRTNSFYLEFEKHKWNFVTVDNDDKDSHSFH